MMSYRLLSELHIIASKQMIDATYYREIILEKSCKEALERIAENVSVLSDHTPKHVRNLPYARWSPCTYC